MGRAQHKTNRKRKKRKGGILKTFLLILLLAIAGYYFYQVFHYDEHFLAKTVANDSAISGLTVAEANQKLKEKYEGSTFTITSSGKPWRSISKKDLGIEANFTSELSSALKKQNKWLWFTSYFSSADKVSAEKVELSETALKENLATLKTELSDLNKDRTKTKNASIKKGSDKFEITPEVSGDSLNVNLILKTFEEDLNKGIDTLELENYREKPTVTSSDPELIAETTAMNKIATINASYTITGETITIPKSSIMDWLSYKDKKVSLDDTKVSNYVATLAANYNTSNTPTSFNSTKRGTVTVPAGSLSWSIQVANEAAALKKAILKGEDFNRTPLVSGAPVDASQPLVGTTYVEVDLVNQHMWYYQNGELKLDTDIVSGKPKSPTPAGVFYINNKERNATLRGDNDDGTKYASPVDYWMPINWTGVGIHDSNWQSAYGGDLYKTRGSHGCVNTPPSVMAKLYGMVTVGTPVLVF